MASKYNVLPPIQTGQTRNSYSLNSSRHDTPVSNQRSRSVPGKKHVPNAKLPSLRTRSESVSINYLYEEALNSTAIIT